MPYSRADKIAARAAAAFAGTAVVVPTAAIVYSGAMSQEDIRDGAMQDDGGQALAAFRQKLADYAALTQNMRGLEKKQGGLAEKNALKQEIAKSADNIVNGLWTNIIISEEEAAKIARDFQKHAKGIEGTPWLPRETAFYSLRECQVKLDFPINTANIDKDRVRNCMQRADDNVASRRGAAGLTAFAAASMALTIYAIFAPFIYGFSAGRVDQWIEGRRNKKFLKQERNRTLPQKDLDAMRRMLDGFRPMKGEKTLPAAGVSLEEFNKIQRHLGDLENALGGGGQKTAVRRSLKPE